MADNSKFIQTQTFKLAGGGISLSDTSISLQSFKFPPATGSAPITMAHLGTICTATIEPGAAKEEIISFTGVTQNGDGSATLTGVTRGLKFGDTAGDYGQDLSLRKSHAGNTTFVITNNPQFYNKFAAKDNDEVITGDWQVPAPASGPSVVNKDYVDDAIGGGVGTATDTTFGTVKGTKNQGSKPKVISALVREQATPNKTLKVESLRQTFIDKVVAYAGGDTPNFIDPAMGGDLGFALTPSNGETITITVDGTACVFTAVTTIGATPGNFLIGGSAAVARANFTALINNPTVTSANQVAFSGAQLTAIQKLSATDDLSLNTFIRVTNPATATFSVTETMAGAGNIWTVNSTKTRYDILVIDNAGTLQTRRGVEAVSPVVPTPTSGDLTLALILNRVGMTTVRDTNIAGQGYIVELYTPSIYRTDIATVAQLPASVTSIAAETLAVGDPVSGFFYQSDNGITLNAKASVGGTTTTAGGAFSVPVTVAANANRRAVAYVICNSSGGTSGVTATFDAVSMTNIQNNVGIGSGLVVYSWTLPNCNSGAARNFTATFPNNGQQWGYWLFIYVYDNCDQTNIDGSTSGSGVNSIAITPINEGTRWLCMSYTGNGTGNNLSNLETRTGGFSSVSVQCGDSGIVVPKIGFNQTQSSASGMASIGIRPFTAPVFGYAKKTSAANTTNACEMNAYSAFLGFVTAITGGGVLGTTTTIKENGVITGLSGLTPLATYYLSNTSGVISTAAGTNSKKIGVALTSTSLLIKHDN